MRASAVAPAANGGAPLTTTEIRAFIDLAIAQLDGAVKESDGRVDRLSAALVGLRQSLDEMTDMLAHHASPALLAARLEAMGEQIGSAVVAMQFYDKLTQRLAHVRDGLAIPAQQMDPTPCDESPQYPGTLAQIRARYSMVEERVIFDFLMKGTGPEQMLAALADLRGATNPGELELF